MPPPWPDWPVREALLVLVLGSLMIGAGVAPSAAQSGGSPLAVAQSDVDADAVLLSVTLQADGDAQWRVEYRVRLDDENTTAAFESLQQDVKQNESAFVTRFEDRMTTTVEDAAASTGREMAVRNVTVTTTTQQLPQEYGVLVYTFEWTGFAVVEGDRLVAGDALAGFFLDADSSLSMAWPADYSLADVSPEPTEIRDRSVVWRGPTEFGTDQPRLVVTTAARHGDGIDTSLLGLGVVGAVLIGGALLWWWRYRAGNDPGAPGAAEAADSGVRAEPDEEPAAPPDDLLSNEERVIALLEEHGGRMKQQAVVEELGWTDAKTSQVVGKLRDAGDIEGFRLGRENVLRLPEVDDSPAPGDVVSEDEPDET
ncbi:MAG: helix-turn-helix transcriptional regulator [Halobacteriales archaeon]